MREEIKKKGEKDREQTQKHEEAGGWKGVAPTPAMMIREKGRRVIPIS